MIALYVHELRATGVVRNCRLLAAHLAETGRDVTIVTATGGGDVPTGVGHHALLTDKRVDGFLGKIRAGLALRQWCRRTRPDILISMGNHGHLTVLTALSVLRRRPSSIFRISNDLVRDIPGAPVGSAAAVRFRRLAARSIARNADAVVAVAPRLVDNRLFEDARRAGRVHVIANGIDADKARAAAGGDPPHPWLAGGDPVILAVGRLDTQKNYGALIEAFAMLQEVRASRLMIIGSSRLSDRRDALFAKAVDRGVDDRLALIDHTDNIFSFYRHADCFVLPSWWEGSPNVLLEAMALGLPVAASQSAGNAEELLGHGQHGCLFDPADSTAMAACLAGQLDPDRRILPGDALKGYNIADTLRHWDDLLTNIG